MAITLLVLEDGRFRDRPLPPFGATPHPRQREWVRVLQQAIVERRDPLPFDPELGWVNRPLGQGERPGTRFNSIGARGTREYDPLPPEGVLRVIAFGDSFTYGSEVDDDQAWTAQLEGLDPALEVLNLGVGAYGTDQALLRFRREGLHGAQVAMIGLLVENIGRNVSRYRPLYYPRSYNASAKPRFVLDAGRLELVPMPFATASDLVAAVVDGSVLERLSEHDYWAGDVPLVPGSSLARLVAGYSAYARRRPERLWADVEGEPFRVTLALLEAFHAEALAAGAQRTLVLVFPRESELERLESDGEPYWGTLHRSLAERGIPYLDLAGVLLDPWRSGQVGFVQGHLDPAANRVVAERLRKWLPGS